jgi:cytosine/adenosine deaminase-related metal-dependent hydrolase
VGGLKNLLAGVTTVAHHNPFYRELRLGFPIRVVRRYGWAHSFLLERAPAGARGELGGDVADRCRSTPKGAPFFVHLAEGVDDAAEQELARFEALGCLGPNVVLVHGVAIDPGQWPRVAASGTGLVWCPASNDFLFGRTAPVKQFTRGRIALGTDSRLSGARDLLDELRVASAAAVVSPEDLVGMVTGVAADLIGQPAGRLRVGAAADLLVIPRLADTAASSLLAATRADVALVVVGGRPRVGDRARADVFAARGIAPQRIRVDGAHKLADPALARRIAECPIAEPGVEAA